MSRNKIIFTFGLLVLLMPFLGFPQDWRNVFYIILGFLIMVMAVWNRVERSSKAPSQHGENDVFAEYVPQSKSDA